MNIRLPMPHKGQQIVKSKAKKFNYIAAGRRWRKSSLALINAVEAALSRKVVLWTAPTYNQLYISWLELIKACNGVVDFNQTRMIATFPTGGSITFRSLEKPDNARGFTADVLIVDEAGDIPDKTWYEILRPMLLGTTGQAWVFGTPKLKNWFFVEHFRATTTDNNAIGWSIPTLGVIVVENENTGEVWLERAENELENPDITFEEILEIFADMSLRAFKQEILAMFLDDSTEVFEFIKKAATIVMAKKPYNSSFVAGLDLGRSIDYTVLSIVDVNKKSQVYYERFNSIGYKSQIRRIDKICKAWNIEYLLVEENNVGTVIAEQLDDLGINLDVFNTNSATKNPLIEDLAFAYEKDLFYVINDKLLLDEHATFQRIVNQISNKYRYAAAPRKHDDIVMATAISYKALKQFHTEGFRELDNEVYFDYANFTGV